MKLGIFCICLGEKKTEFHLFSNLIEKLQTKSYYVETEKSAFASSYINRNHIVFSIFRLILNQTEFRLVANQSKNGKINLISVYLTETRRGLIK